MTRTDLLFRTADLLRRTGVDDAEAIIRELERRVMPPADGRTVVVRCTKHGRSLGSIERGWDCDECVAEGGA